MKVVLRTRCLCERVLEISETREPGWLAVPLLREEPDARDFVESSSPMGYEVRKFRWSNGRTPEGLRVYTEETTL